MVFIRADGSLAPAKPSPPFYMWPLILFWAIAEHVRSFFTSLFVAPNARLPPGVIDYLSKNITLLTDLLTFHVG